jgi:hypothetical protein
MFEEVFSAKGCHYVHDNDLGKEVSEKMQNDPKMIVSCTNLQGQYNNSLTPKTPSIIKSNKANRFVPLKVNNAGINARIESIINLADKEVKHSTPANLDSNFKSSPVTNFGSNLKVKPVKVTPFHTTYRLSWATVTYSKPNAQLARRFPLRSWAHCRRFLAGVPHNPDTCRYTHPCPENPNAPWPAVVETPFLPQMECYLDMRCSPPQTKQRRFCPAPKYSWDVYNAMAPPEDQLPKDPYIIEAPKQTYANAASRGLGRRSKTSSEGSAVFSSQFGNSSHSTSNDPQLSDAERWALEVAPVKIPAPPVRRRCRDRARANATFPRFSELPAELRNKIWYMAFNDHSQTVRLAWRWDDEHEGNYYGSRLDPLCRAPELLQVCKEARDIGLGHYYRQSFGTMQSRPNTWFNFENDKIFLQTRSALQLVNTAKQLIRRERQLIKGLMLPLRDFVHNPDSFVEVVTSFINLRQICLVASKHPEDKHWTQDKKLAHKVKKAIEARWTRRQEKYRPEDKLPVPLVGRKLLNPMVAKCCGVDGIVWGANVRHDQRVWNQASRQQL